MAGSLPGHVDTPEGRMKGSFVSPARISDQIKQDRAQAAVKAERDQEASRAAEKTAAEKKEAASSHLPESVDSAIYGKLPYREYKEKYGVIFDAIRDKVHLSRGFVEHAATITGKQRVLMRTLTRGQQTIVSHLSKAENFVNTMAVPDQQEWFRWFLFFAIVEFGNAKWAVGQPPRIYETGPLQEESEAKLRTYIESKEVQSKLDWLDGLDFRVYNQIRDIALDLTNAVALGIQEDILNP